MGAECSQGDKVCQAMNTCPEPAPGTNHTDEHAPANGAEPHPHQGDPLPPQTANVKTPVTFTCTWFAKVWIEFTPSIGGEPRITKEKKYDDSSGGSYEETIGVDPGQAVALDCKIMDDQEGEYPKNLNCTIKAFGKILPGGGYQRANDRVHCFATV